MKKKIFKNLEIQINTPRFTVTFHGIIAWKDSGMAILNSVIALRYIFWMKNIIRFEWEHNVFLCFLRHQFTHSLCSQCVTNVGVFSYCRVGRWAHRMDEETRTTHRASDGIFISLVSASGRICEHLRLKWSFKVSKKIANSDSKGETDTNVTETGN